MPRSRFFFVLLDCLEINKNEEVKNSCPFQKIILQHLISVHLSQGQKL
jgi:hypothetical protein